MNASVEIQSETWNMKPWRKIEQHVYRIQKRIYRASQRGNVRKVQKLEKLLMKSNAARLLAVRRVTQDNRGKKTAGTDGIKSVTPAKRLIMANQIHPKHWKKHKAKPVRRVWIPKPGKAERRPLGIPTMLDRSKQALAKLALEPEWETRFEPNSYGFRPGRSCHDAIAAIFSAIRYRPKYVLDADIKGCFDNINQDALVKKLNTYTQMRQTIKEWLKAGVMDRLDLTPTEKGTPQGGVISPLLANIALHGLEQCVNQRYKRPKESLFLIRYADDFILLHSDKNELDKATTQITEHLADMGLILSPTKTKVTHTLNPYHGSVGFNFLGFSIRQFTVGKTHTGKKPHGKPLGFKTIIKPSKESVKRHQRETKQRLRQLRSRPQWQVIEELNPVIRGWTNYYRTVVSSVTFVGCDHVLWHQLWRWSRIRHPRKGDQWVKRKYWRTIGSNHWVFTTPEGAQLRKHSMTHIQRHIKVKGEASPYDGHLLYWSQRLKTHPLTHGTLARALQRQHGRCGWCGLFFRDGDVIEIDHRDRNRGNNAPTNLFALHRHCHDKKHAKDATDRCQSQLTIH
jgi:RNA-directed DNA polymerase